MEYTLTLKDGTVYTNINSIEEWSFDSSFFFCKFSDGGYLMVAKDCVQSFHTNGGE